jgi:hypothetical protein
VLIGGLRAFTQGNSALSQKLMRWRVAAQGGTVAALAGMAAWRAYTEPATPMVDPRYVGNLNQNLPTTSKELLED